jgi:hypothetical protein
VVCSLIAFKDCLISFKAKEFSISACCCAIFFCHSFSFKRISCNNLYSYIFLLPPVFQPYLGNSADVFSNSDPYGPAYQGLRDSMNNNGVEFGLHTGDTKSGSTVCNDTYYNRFRTLSNSLNYPTLYTIGDNEWTDCHRVNNGNYDPLERLAYVRSRFFNANGTSVLGKGTIQTSSFNITPYVENQYFTYKNLMIALLHVPGSNNNFYDGGPSGGSCPSTINATIDPGCVKATAEFLARDAATIVSLRKVFELAKLNRNPGILITIQADFLPPGNVNSTACNSFGITVANVASKIPTGFHNFTRALLQETANYTGKVLLQNGDSHFYRNCNPTTLSNFQYVMVPGSDTIGWVLATIDPDTPEVFRSFQAIYPAPVTSFKVALWGDLVCQYVVVSHRLL